MKKQLEKILKETQNKFPDDLDSRINAIMNCVNTETKQILLVFCLNDDIKTTNDLEKDFRNLGIRGWIPADSNIKGYCQGNFVPYGIAYEELFPSDKYLYPTATWWISQAGKKYGKPIAAFSLKWAVDNGISMCSIFGTSASPKKTTCSHNRFKLLDNLKENETHRSTDLAIKSNLHSSSRIGWHLYEFKKIGFIIYESVGFQRTNWIRYIWTGKSLNEIKPIEGYGNGKSVEES